MNALGKCGQRGFSLIEIIIGLVVFAILASMFVSFLGTPLRESIRPVVRLKNTMSLQEVMENITADFKASQDLVAIKAAIDAGSYGSYTVVDNEYVKFVGNDDVVDTTDHDLLKITLQSTVDDFSLTLLLADW